MHRIIRARGEQSTENLGMQSCLGSSPRARGAGFVILLLVCLVGIIPARAGSRLCALGSTLRVRDHPRARGEQNRNPTNTLNYEGSSPRARGAD